MTGTPMRAIAPWDPSDREPILLRAGDVVTVGRRDDEWPGFRWCTDSAGVSGWVPEEFLHEGRVLEDYSAAELAVRPGDEVEALRLVAGWWWCLTPDGAGGWIPEKVLAR